MARQGRALLQIARTQAARPRRARPRLHLPELVSSLVRGDRRRVQEAGRRDRRPDPRPPVPGEGAVSLLVHRAGEPVHRHHDERADHLLRGEGDRRRETFRTRQGALPDHGADDHPGQRQHRPRRNLRHQHRRVPPSEHPSGTFLRIRLDPRAGLVALRVRHRLHLHQRPGRPRRRRTQRRPLHRPLPRWSDRPLGLRRG